MTLKQKLADFSRVMPDIKISPKRILASPGGQTLVKKNP